MEQFDHQMAARVWERVQGGSAAENPPADIYLFLQEEQADLSRYRQLLGVLGSTHKLMLQQLIQKTQLCVSVLRGILFYLTDVPPEKKVYPLPKELPVSALRRCYGATLQRSSRYTQWEHHSEFAPGFSKLAELSRERCQLLLQLAGHCI